MGQYPRSPRPPERRGDRTDRAPHRRRYRLSFAIAIAACLVLCTVAWPRWPHAARAQGPAVTLDPASGPAGSMVSISATDFPYVTTLQPATILFDVNGQPTTVVTGQKVAECTTTPGTRTFGFGTLCTGTAVTFQVPAAAAPGPHTVTVVITKIDYQNGQFSAQATFTVTAPPTATATPTGTAASTATSTATPSATAVPATGTATSTGIPPATSTSTPVLSTPTSTATPAPSVPGATATLPLPTSTLAPPTVTATGTPVKKAVSGFLVLAKPAFAAGTLALSAHALPQAAIHITFVITAGAQGHTTTGYALARDGTADGLGRYAALLHIDYHNAGMATLTVTMKRGAITQTVVRRYPYRG